jgi:hypothetical protein
VARIPDKPQHIDDNKRRFQATAGWDGTEYHVIFADSDGNIQVRNLIYDTVNMIWIASTGGSGGPSTQVEVTNFPTTYFIKNAGGTTINPAISDRQSVLAKYVFSDYAASGTDYYVGNQAADGNWYIMKYDSASGNSGYVAGSSNYSTSWSARTGLSYDTPENTF